MTKVLISLSLYLVAFTSQGQYKSLKVAPNAILPRDTALSRQLCTSLDAFFGQIEGVNAANEYVHPQYLLETSLLMDEMKELRASAKYKDPDFYKCYLANAVRIDDSLFIIQVAFMGQADGVPLLRASFKMMGLKTGNKMLFYSPLARNTANWHSTQFGSTTFYYGCSVDMKKVKAYFKKVKEFDEILKASPIVCSMYYCGNLVDALQISGVDFKSDYNASSQNTISSMENGQVLQVNGSLWANIDNPDPHDLWHARLHNIVPVATINKPVDEGMAYLFGGSWALSWETILDKFKAYAAANKQADWLSLYNQSFNYDPTAKYPLNVDYTINALVVRQLMKDKGIEAVKELCTCGKREAGNANYFAALERITGINKSNFNQRVAQMIEQ